MLSAIEMIKEQIKAMQYESQQEKKTEVQELRELVEFLNYDRSILLSENQRLTKLNEENIWKAKFLEMQDMFNKEKEKNYELMLKIEELEDILNLTNHNKSLMEIGNFTERAPNRAITAKSYNENIGKKLNASANFEKKPIKKANTYTKSPEKPPRGHTDKSLNSTISNKNLNKATTEIKNNLAKAIDQAHKTLFYTVQNKNRSISPCLSSASSRYSTPPKKNFFNTSVISST